MPKRRSEHAAEDHGGQRCAHSDEDDSSAGSTPVDHGWRRLVFVDRLPAGAAFLCCAACLENLARVVSTRRVSGRVPGDSQRSVCPEFAESLLGCSTMLSPVPGDKSFPLVEELRGCHYVPDWATRLPMTDRHREDGRGVRQRNFREDEVYAWAAGGSRPGGSGGPDRRVSTLGQDSVSGFGEWHRDRGLGCRATRGVWCRARVRTCRNEQYAARDLVTLRRDLLGARHVRLPRLDAIRALPGISRWSCRSRLVCAPPGRLGHRDSA